MSAALPPIDEVPAAHLESRTLGNGWTVGPRITRDPGASGGNFSICYPVTHEDGRQAFMKALNFQAAATGPGTLVDQLHRFTNAFIHERDLLADCRARRFSRIIRLLEHGEVNVPEAGTLLCNVPYLILESADGDIRAFQASLDAFDCAWAFRVMKHVLEGLEQLHSAQTAHQDLRPSNVLTQAHGAEMKLGDLGRADRRGQEGPWSKFVIPGAKTYAPPEQQYGAFGRTWEERKGADLYQAGSLGAQLFLGHCMSALLQQGLPIGCRLQEWAGSFDEVLPYLQSAHSQIVRELEDNVESRFHDQQSAADFARAIREMTNPDPTQRGHPRDRAARTSSYAVRRYVSLMNLLATRAHYRLGEHRSV
jgi:serine/threonine protein kinase